MDNTIFDDVFRTMVEKMPYLAVPLINEAFGTNYPDNVEIIQLRNEHHQADGEVITDSCLRIRGKLYHIECQSTDDSTMAVRMIEYDYAIAMEGARRYGRRYRMEFPRSCVLFLRSTAATPDSLEVEVVFPDGKTHIYQLHTLKMANYTKDKLFEKNLLMLLPFYAIRYEKKIPEIERNPEEFHKLLKDYESIRLRLEHLLENKARAAAYTDLTNLIVKIADYIFRKDNNIQKGIGEIMGGKVLELESERLHAKGLAEGLAQGHMEGINEGEEKLSLLINMLIANNRSGEIQGVVSDKRKREEAYREFGL